MSQQKIDAIVECSDQLDWALNSLDDIDEEDDKITEIHWEIKDVISTIDKYLKELTKCLSS